MKRQSLPIQQKKEVLAEFKRRKCSNEPCSQHILLLWAEEKFSLSKPLPQPVISRILNSKAYPNCKNISHNYKRTPCLTNPFIEKALATWVSAQFARRVNISGEMINLQGQRIQDELKKVNPSDKYTDLKFSKGWLQKFQKRWDLKCHKSFGEDGDANVSAIAEHLPRLQQKLKGHAFADVWNADQSIVKSF